MTGRFLTLFGVTTVLVVAIVFWARDIGIRERVAEVRMQERHAVARVVVGATRDLAGVATDVLVLASSPGLQHYLDSGTGWLRFHLAAEFETLAAHARVYDQIRLIDASGLERIRVNHRDGQPQLAPDEDLQDKSGRYYVDGTLSLEAGRIFISQLDLNVERGEIELPYRPTIRVGTPVRSERGHAAGLIIINYHGNALLEHARSLMAGAGELMIVNPGGYWVLAPDPADAWGFMLDHGRSLADRHPDVWAAAAAASSGAVATEEGLFVFDTVRLREDVLLNAGGAGPRVAAAPHLQSNANYWRVISFVDRNTLFAEGVMTLREAAALSLGLVIGLGVLQVSFFRLAQRRRIAEQASKLAHDRLVNAVESLPSGFAIYDAEDRLALCNQKYLETYAATGTAIALGQTFEDILKVGLRRGQYPDAIGREEAWLSERLARHRTPYGEMEQRLPNGRWVLVRERRTSSGEIVGDRADITVLKRREEDLIEANRRIEEQADDLRQLADDLRRTGDEAEAARRVAERANRAKSDFLASMSHELRTPLNSIIGFSEVIRDEIFGPAGTPEYADYAGDIHYSGRHLLGLINQVLDLSKIEAGKMEIRPAPLDTEEVIRDSVRLIYERADRKNLTVNVAFAFPVPTLLADESALRQIMFNLLSNAVKFTPAGGRIDIDVTHPCAEHLLVTVADTGCGIPQDQIDRLLQPFERLDNAYDRASDGTGLGLAISKSLAELHGGMLEIASTLNLGTSVRLILPVYLAGDSVECGVGLAQGAPDRQSG